MKAQTYRPKVQNGRVARRMAAASASGSQSRSGKRKVTAAKTARGRSRREKKSATQGSQIFWGIIVVGVLIASGFIFALRSQISVHRLGQAEAELRSELVEIANHQRYEILQQQRAMNAGESDRAARAAGLLQPRLSDRVTRGKAKKEQPIREKRNKRK